MLLRHSLFWQPSGASDLLSVFPSAMICRRRVIAMDSSCILALSLLRLMQVNSMFFRSNLVHVFPWSGYLFCCIDWRNSATMADFYYFMIHVRFCKLQPRILLFTFILVLWVCYFPFPFGSFRDLARMIWLMIWCAAWWRFEGATLSKRAGFASIRWLFMFCIELHD